MKYHNINLSNEKINDNYKNKKSNEENLIKNIKIPNYSYTKINSNKKKSELELELSKNKINLKVSSKISNVKKEKKKNVEKITNKFISINKEKVSKFSLKKLGNNLEIPLNIIENRICPPRNELKSQISIQKYNSTNHIKNNSASSKNLTEKLEKKLTDKLDLINESNNDMSSDFITRGKDFLVKKYKNLEIKKTEINKKIKTKSIEMSIKSKEMTDRDNNDFLTRMKKFTEKVENYRKVKMDEKWKKEEDIIQIVKNKHKLKSFQNDEKYKLLINWKNKINQENNERKNSDIENLKQKCTFKPKISKKSTKIISLKNNFDTNNNFVNRLYNEDQIKRKNNHEILKSIYTPSFSPIINYKTCMKEYNLNFNTTTNSINNNELSQRGINRTKKNLGFSKNKLISSFSLDKNDNSMIYHSQFNIIDTTPNNIENALKEKFNHIFMKFKKN